MYPNFSPNKLSIVFINLFQISKKSEHLFVIHHAKIVLDSVCAWILTQSRASSICVWPIFFFIMYWFSLSRDLFQSERLFIHRGVLSKESPTSCPVFSTTHKNCLCHVVSLCLNVEHKMQWSSNNKYKNDYHKTVSPTSLNSKSSKQRKCR